jgi:hypothetical protein
MSTLNVSNITDGTTTVGTSYVVNGSAKAHVNFDGNSIAIRTGSLNISSVTDNATGKYTPNFSNNFGAAPSATGGMTVPNYPGLMRVNPSTTSCQIFTSTSYSSAYIDSSDTSIQCCGDLA